MKLLIINGPNLNLLGKRETTIYGGVTFEEYLKKLRKQFPDLEIDCFQSNVEGEIINTMQKVDLLYDGVIINAGGYSHTSVSIGDAVKAIDTPVVEIHISNVYQREEYRQKSLIAPGAKGMILGFGMDSYRLAVESFLI